MPLCNFLVVFLFFIDWCIIMFDGDPLNIILIYQIVQQNTLSCPLYYNKFPLNYLKPCLKQWHLYKLITNLKL